LGAAADSGFEFEQVTGSAGAVGTTNTLESPPQAAPSELFSTMGDSATADTGGGVNSVGADVNPLDAIVLEEQVRLPALAGRRLDFAACLQTGLQSKMSVVHVPEERRPRPEPTPNSISLDGEQVRKKPKKVGMKRQCKICGGMGHYQKTCQSRPQNQGNLLEEGARLDPNVRALVCKRALSSPFLSALLWAGTASPRNEPAAIGVCNSAAIRAGVVGKATEWRPSDAKSLLDDDSIAARQFGAGAFSARAGAPGPGGSHAVHCHGGSRRSLCCLSREEGEGQRCGRK
jgi:hypothetical protein